MLEWETMEKVYQAYDQFDTYLNKEGQLQKKLQWVSHYGV